MRVMVPNSIHTRVLFILSRITREAKDAAAPNSKAIAREIASH
jgi:hypothetical protein